MFRAVPFLLIEITANGFAIVIFFTFRFANPRYD